MVYKHSGDFVTADEAAALLSSLGEVAEADQLDAEIQHSMRLPPTIVIRYKMYDPRRDVPLVSFLFVAVKSRSLTCRRRFGDIASTK